jgi:hypothetical protein
LQWAGVLDSRFPEPLLESEQRRKLRLSQPAFPDEYLSQLFSALSLLRQGLIELRARDAAGLDQQLTDGFAWTGRGLKDIFEPDPLCANVLNKVPLFWRQPHGADEVLDEILR